MKLVTGMILVMVCTVAVSQTRIVGMDRCQEYCYRDASGRLVCVSNC